MSKLCVIATGLAALAPPVASDPTAKVLLRRLDTQQMLGGPGGQIALPHLAVLRFTTGAGAPSVQDHVLAGETVQFTLSAAGAPTIQNPGQFVAIGPSLSNPLPAKPIFRGAGDPTVMSGRVVLTGGGISPIELNQLYDLSQISRTITAELTGSQILGGGASALPVPPRLVANGFLFERVLAAGEKPQIVIGTGPAIPLAPTTADLGFLDGETGDVYIVWATNTAVPQNGVPQEKKAGGPRQPTTPGVAASVGSDPDFNLLYDFVQAGPGGTIASSSRLVPLISVGPTGPGEPPGRCSPGITG